MTTTDAPTLLNRVMIYVKDMEASERFYLALGFEVESRNEEIVRFVDRQGTTLVIHEQENDWETVSRGCRLYVGTHDADALVARVVEQCPQVEVLQPVRMMSWGRAHAYLLDPSGWEISLYEPGDVAGSG